MTFYFSKHRRSFYGPTRYVVDHDDDFWFVYNEQTGTIGAWFPKANKEAMHAAADYCADLNKRFPL